MTAHAPGGAPLRGDVAIIGVAGVFPGARDVRQFWENILAGVDATGDPPPDWEAELYLDPTGAAEDRPYCVRGGYLGPLAEFSPAEYGVMPNSVDGTEPDHFLALRAASAALQDAGYLTRPLNRERVEVVIGRGTYVNRGNTTVIQHTVMLDQFLRILKHLHPEHSDEELARIRTALKASLPPFHVETAPGLVPNIISGRVANRLDCMGPNYLVDAACASSLVAVDHGMRDLLSGRCDVAIVGGIHASTPPPIVTIFCQLNAISRRGQIRPFDARADGTLLGEGVGMIVLRRLADAERDGDRIYAVLKGVGVSSDGRALGLLAPRLEGEELALRRAYDAAAVPPATVGLVEAHGTATTVGDVVEIEALRRVFGEREGAIPGCAVGSVKSMIGHLMPASGIAGLIKAAMALHHRVLPPTIHCEEPNPKLELPRSNFYLNTRTRPWIHGGDAPRRAGVNAFGFGGVNAHAVLEEYTGPHAAPALQQTWDSEVFICAGDSRESLMADARQLLAAVDAHPEWALKDVAFTMNTRRQAGPCRLAIVAGTHADLQARLARAIGRLADSKTTRIRDVDGIYYTAKPLAEHGTVAFVFPGEGSQYPDMLADLCIHFPAVRRVFDFMDRAFVRHPRGHLPSALIFPPPTGEPRPPRDADPLFRMDSGAEAVFTANQALAALLAELQIRPHAMVGHSTGEHSALLASATVQVRDDEELIGHVLGVNGIFERLQERGDIPEGLLIAAGGVPLADLQRIVAACDGQVHIAMDNCPHQVVLCGSEQGIERAAALLAERRAICQPLPFARAYHTPLFEVFCRPMREYFRRVAIAPPTGLELYSCVTAAPFPADADEIRELVSMQWARPVRFRETIEAMHRDGVRVFVEVGPKGTLVSFIDDILRGQEYVALPANVLHRSGIAQLNHLIAQLTVHGIAVNYMKLYERRAPVPLPIEQPASSTRRPAPRTVTLATGLQPMRLPAEFEWTSAAPRRASAAAQPIPVVPAVTARPPAPAPAAAPASGAAAAPVAQHFETMSQFLDVQRRVMHAYLRRSVAPRTGGASSAGGALPFVGTITSIEPGVAVTFRRTLDAADDCFLVDHTLGRHVSADNPALLALPAMPLTFTMEVLAEAAALIQPHAIVVGMRDVRASRWITLENGPVTIEAAARVREGGRVHATVRTVAPGDRLGPIAVEATILLGNAFPSPPPAIAVATERASSWTPDRLYGEALFHGPLFQAVRRVDRFGSHGAVVTLETLPRRGLFRTDSSPAFLTDAVLLDAAGQALAFWAKELLGSHVDVFPFRLVALDLYAPPLPAGQRVECRIAPELVGDRFTRCDIDLLDERGLLIARLHSWEDRRFELPSGLLALRRSPQTAFVSESSPQLVRDLPGGDRVACCRLDRLGEELLESTGGIWMHMLAHLVLSRRERAVWYGMDAVPKRRREWLLGRAVAKDAVRTLLRERRGVCVAPADVEILPDGAGRPTVHGAWRAALGVEPVVSIAHSAGCAVALAALEPDRLIGIDLECVSGRTGGFERMAFTPEERRLLETLDEAARGEWHLRLWCAKEAAGKALGRGLADGLHAMQVTDAGLRDGRITIQLGAGLERQFPALAGRPLDTVSVRDGDFVLSAVVCGGA